MKVPWDLEDEVKKGKATRFWIVCREGRTQKLFNKRMRKGSEDRSCVFPFPFFFHSERWKKASFLARTTTTNHSRWIGVGRAWHQTQTGFLRRHNLLQITTQIKPVHTQCWKMILPFWDCESDKCFLLSFESPWKWQKQCNKVLKVLFAKCLVFEVDLAFFRGGI